MNQSSKPTHQPEFIIQRVYVKDLSLETPHSPQAFQEEWQPELNLQFTMNTSDIGADNHEVVLQITVTAKSKDKTLFLVEVKQAGLFTLKGFTEEQNHQVMSITCPTILFPYAREAVSDLVGRAGFPPLYLAPVNFEALYAQQMQEQDDKGGSGKKENSSNSIITH
ncbi:protein-export chaperone SecB [Rickettsiella endosymbiont of Aleochara curtula]|uniref:protein-export chaperone SecB n=1 Tax=Rickettsiella endosymbiont of Aleochara curtula TaxID=3077936 RepID=UPI00313C4B1F